MPATTSALRLLLFLSLSFSLSLSLLFLPRTIFTYLPVYKCMVYYRKCSRPARGQEERKKEKECAHIHIYIYIIYIKYTFVMLWKRSTERGVDAHCFLRTSYIHVGRGPENKLILPPEQQQRRTRGR